MPADWADRVVHRLKLRDLRVLQAVADCGSMAKASERLGISHPVISKAISELEHVLGVRLLDRSSRGVEPTIYGRALLTCGTAVFDEVRQGLNQIEFLTKPNTGELRIGCPEALSAGLLPDIAERFARQCPRARLHVAHADTGKSQFGGLRARNIDLLIGTMPGPSGGDDLVMDPLLNERFAVVAGPTSSWSRRRHVALNDLLNEPWVLPPHDSAPGRRIADIFAENDLALPQAGIVGLSIHLTIALVATGRFVALLPEAIARLNARRGLLKVLPVRLPEHEITIGIVTLKKRTASPLAANFVGCAHHVARSLSNARSRA